MTVKLLAVLLLVIAVGCVKPMTQYEREQLTRNRVTVFVVNSGFDTMRIYEVSYGTPKYMGTLIGGESGCYMLISSSSTIQLLARTIDGDWYSPDFIGDDSPTKAWRWEIGKTPRYDRISLQPDRAKCLR